METPKPARERLDPVLRKMIGITAVGVIAVYLDTTVVNVALNTLSRDLGTSVSTTQWVTTSYLLSLGMVVPLSAWAGARFGAKAVWLFSLSLFLAGSVAAGSSWNIGSLICFRVVQGLGGGLMFTTLQTLIVQAAQGRSVGRVIASLGLPAVAVPVLGPVIGGLILTNTTWRWIFFLNVPLCLTALILAWRGLPETPPMGRRPLDLLGVALLSPSLALVLYGLSRAGTSGFTATAVLVCVAAGLLLLAAFVAHTLRRSGDPVVDLRLFRIRAFAVSSVLLFLSGLSLYGGLLLVPLYFQRAQGHSALVTGLLLIPQGVGSLIARGPIGGLTDRAGPRRAALVGVVLTGLGLLPFTLLPHHPGAVLLGAAMVVLGTGLSVGLTAVTAAAYKDLPQSAIPHATSTIRIVQQVGGSFGTAVLAVLLQRQITVHRPGDRAELLTAFGNTFSWALGFVGVALVGVLLLPRPPRASAAAEADGTADGTAQPGSQHAARAR